MINLVCLYTHTDPMHYVFPTYFVGKIRIYFDFSTNLLKFPTKYESRTLCTRSLYTQNNDLVMIFLLLVYLIYCFQGLRMQVRYLHHVIIILLFLSATHTGKTMRFAFSTSKMKCGPTNLVYSTKLYLCLYFYYLLFLIKTIFQKYLCEDDTSVNIIYF